MAKQKTIRYSEFTKLRCKKAYVKQRMTLSAISRKHKVPVSTLTNWKRTQNWDEEKQLYTTTSQAAVDIARNELNSLVTETLPQADTQSKRTRVWTDIRAAMKLLDHLEKDMDIKRNAIEMMDSFSDFILAHCKDDDFIEKLTDWSSQWFEYIKTSS